jgi:hypothetical protein
MRYEMVVADSNKMLGPIYKNIRRHINKKYNPYSLLRVFENRTLSRIFAPKRDEATGGLEKTA